MIIANRVGSDCGFDYDENTVCVYWRGGHQAFEMAAKTELAHDLFELVAERFNNTQGTGSPPASNVVSIKE